MQISQFEIKLIQNRAKFYNIEYNLALSDYVALNDMGIRDQFEHILQIRSAFPNMEHNS